jgi:hypothetical protein
MVPRRHERVSPVSAPHRPHTPSADASVALLTDKLLRNEPFVFTKFGDGDLWWLAGTGAEYPNAYGERYTEEARRDLIVAADELAGMPHAYFGDQLTCRSGPYLETEQTVYLAGVRESAWLHFETLLIHRLTPELLNFYRVVSKLPQKDKILCCGSKYRWGATVLKSRYMSTHNSESHLTWRDTRSFLAGNKGRPWNEEWKYLFLSCGRASKMIAATLAVQFPDRTIIELGSALEPLIIGRTRSEQIDSAAAREYFKELL